jgi:hypothetical protein
VVGATVGRHGHRLDDLRGPILAPGLGAQGGSVTDLPAVFGAALPAVLPAVSREVLAGGPTVAGLRAAAARLAGELGTVQRAPEPGTDDRNGRFDRPNGSRTLPLGGASR